MPKTGKIMPIELKASTPVKKGETVALMKQDDLNTAVKECQAKVDAIKKQIELNQYNEIEKKALEESEKWIKVMGDSVEAALRKAEASKARNKYAQWYLESNRKMRQTNAISQKQFHEAEMKGAEAQVKYEADLFSYSSAKTFHTVSFFLPLYIKMFLVRKSIEGNVLQANLNEAEASLDKAQRDLRNGTMVSPIDGVILKRYLENEQYLEAGTKLLDIGDLNTLQVRANILSVYASDIVSGNDAEIFGPSIGPKPVKGKVLRVHPKGFVQISSLGVREERIPIDIEINSGELNKLKNEQNRMLGVGFRVEARIYTSKADNAIIIPRTALFRGNGDIWQLCVANGRIAELRTVEVGIVNDREAQIIKGVSAGEKVIIAPTSTLKNGDRISADIYIYTRTP
jgi:HlyD family secretion protein